MYIYMCVYVVCCGQVREKPRLCRIHIFSFITLFILFPSPTDEKGGALGRDCCAIPLKD